MAKNDDKETKPQGSEKSKVADKTKEKSGEASAKDNKKEADKTKEKSGEASAKVNKKDAKNAKDANEKAKEENMGDPDAKVEVPECKLMPEGELHSTTGKYDSHAFFVHCSHDKVLLSKRNDVRWMPFIEMPPTRSWEDGALVGFCLVLAASNKAKFDELKKSPPFKSYKCMHLLRIQMPQTLKFIKRTTYYFVINPEATNFKCCQEIASHLEWFPLADIKAGKVPHLWGPELIECSKHISDTVKEKIAEYSLEEMYKYVPRDPPRNLEEDMLKSLQITQTDVERLYADFVAHCYPSFYLTVDSFRAYMSKYNFEKDESKVAKLFDAFNTARNGYLSFHDLLLGLASMEPNATHDEFRARFIFRYYDTDRAGTLNEDKLKLMVADMYPEEKESKLGEITKALGGSSVSEKDFVAAIGSQTLSDTTGLCRMPKAIFSEISRSLALKHLKRVDVKKVLSNALPKKAHKGACPTCVEKKFVVASHLVTVNTEGQLASKRLGQIKVSKPKPDDKGPTAQQYSIECIFKPYSVANTVIKLLREFAKNKGTVAEPKALLQDRKDDFWKLLLKLYKELCVLLEVEFKCQKAYSPCYIIGDIHGNIEDLLSMEKTLWPLMPIVGAGCLFLGDYVDRGQWGLECTLYIAAFKLLCPNRVTMLRGNHEERACQKHYTYQKECVLKYGEEIGLKVWELTNRIYDKLPVCGLVDDAIYCAHGGIPHAAKTTDQIAAVKRDIREPEKESDIAWEILWSDPACEQEFLDTCEQKEVDPKTTNGFVFNTKRGTAFKFNETGADFFLKGNMLTHIIRAHEVAPPGYVFHFVNKCVTIFSTSHYCGNNNLCGFILADNQRMRVIHLDTAANGSATD